MPPPSSRMTKNQAQPTRYRPGKAEYDDPQSEEEESEDEEDDVPPSRSAPAAAQRRSLAVDLSKAGQQKSAAPSLPTKTQEADLEGFVTASESSEDGDEDDDSNDDSSNEEESSEEEDSSSDEEPKKRMLAPKFISKSKRAQQGSNGGITAAEKEAEEERRRKEKADEMLQAQLERDAAARAEGKKYWDDEDVAGDEPDTEDDVDPEAERAAWKLRELKRVKRERLAIEEREKEREEIERRRNLTAEEREEEDRKFIEAQKEDREDRGKMAYMQKYFHKGAFFNADGDQVDEDVKAVLNRDLAGARFEDETGDKAVLPEYMRIRDMTKLGKKGRTKYKDLKNEDTGRWGADAGRKKREYDGLDERFRPDEGGRGVGGERERTGANNAPVGERKKARYD